MPSREDHHLSSIILLEHRCKCGKLLLKGLISSGEFEIKCKNCHAIYSVGKEQDALLDNLHYSILFSLDGRIVDASDSCTPILDYSKEELKLMRIQEIYPLLKISTYAHFSKISPLLGSEPLTFETLSQNKQGKFALVKTTIKYPKDRQGATTQVLFECVQKPMQNINAVARKNTVNNHCELISKITDQGIYTYVSSKLATTLGYPSIEMLGKSIFDFHPTSTKQSFQKTFFQNSALKESFKLSPHIMFCNNKDAVYLESYFASDHNDRGQFRGFQILSWVIS